MDAATARILDANLNRAREALRVIEEYARFVCDDAAAAAAAKQLRHELPALADALGRPALLDARDTIGDVGRELRTESESRREDAEDVVRAALARATEALRALAEYGKLVNTAAAESAEKLRFRAYDLEQVMLLRAPLAARLRRVRLYVIITAAFCRRDWLEAAELALQGGAACLQLREKGLPDAELLRRAAALRELTARHAALFIVNDRADIARLVGADGVHVGQHDLPVAAVRKIAGSRMLIGRSTHNAGQVAAGLSEHPDYLAVGPMFASTTKPQAHVAGIETLRAAAEHTALPLVAIGGITTENAAAVRAAGASCLCVCSAVVGAADPEAAARNLLAAAEPHDAVPNKTRNTP